jgi:hypothetical protein
MADVFVSIALNALFWGGMSRLAANGTTRSGIDWLFTTAVAGFAVIVVSLELLSLAHQINRVSVAAICLSTGFLGIWRRPPPSVDGVEPARASSPSALSFVAIGLTGWVAFAYLLVGLIFPVEPVSDAPIYHLYFAARWWKAGSLPLVPTPFGEEAAAYFPANGDLWFTWLTTIGRGGPLVKVGQWPFLLLGAAALYALGRRVGASWSAAILPAAVWIGLPIILTQSNLANVDLIWAAFYFIAVYFLLEWLKDTKVDDIHPMFSFALASGIVMGTKTEGAVFVLLLLPLAVAALVTRARPRRQLAWLATGFILPAGYWYARNALLTGNPLYPFQLSAFGRVWADGWYGKAAMEATAYHLPPEAWQMFLARIGLVSGIAGLGLVILGITAGLILALRHSSEPSTRRALALYSTLALAQAALYWYVLPYNTQERFLSPAFGLALIPLSILVDTYTMLQAGVWVVLGWQLLGPLRLGQPWLTWTLPASIVIAAFALRWMARARWVAAGLIVATGCYVAGRPAAAAIAARPILGFYPRAGFAASLVQGWEILERAAAPGGARVAYAGTNLPYYLLGLGLRNDVQYVNINDHADWLPHDYHRDRLRRGLFELAQDPWPQWYRTHSDFESWLANLRARRIEFLFIGRENRHGRLETVGTLPQFPIERVWADAHPDTFVDLGPFDYPVGTIPWVRVYRLTDAP